MVRKGSAPWQGTWRQRRRGNKKQERCRAKMKHERSGRTTKESVLQERRQGTQDKETKKLHARGTETHRRLRVRTRNRMEKRMMSESEEAWRRKEVTRLELGRYNRGCMKMMRKKRCENKNREKEEVGREWSLRRQVRRPCMCGRGRGAMPGGSPRAMKVTPGQDRTGDLQRVGLTS